MGKKKKGDDKSKPQPEMFASDGPSGKSAMELVDEVYEGEFKDALKAFIGTYGITVPNIPELHEEHITPEDIFRNALKGLKDSKPVALKIIAECNGGK